MTETDAAETRTAETPTPTVRPRDAASLLLVREGADGPQALMGRRAKRSRFMPDVYVFPGGALDAGDGRARHATALPVGSEAQMAVGRRPGRARALAMAAVRETFEETGMVVGRPGHPGDATPGWTAFGATGRAPDLADLHYIGRAITPAFIKIRFHARFFMAPASAASGELADSGELLDLRWVNLRPPEDLAIADVTRFILTHAAGLIAAPPGTEMGKAFFTYRNRGRLIAFEGGPPPPAWERARFEREAGQPKLPRPG